MTGTADDIFRCKRCKQTFIEEEFDSHVCTPTLAGVKQDIEFDYYYLTKDKMNRETIVIKGMDGILYGFVRRQKKASDKVPLFSSNDG
jgi:hypothetical protein